MTQSGSTPSPPTNPSQTPLFHSLSSDRYARQQKIRDIEAFTGRRLLCWIGSAGAEINKADVPPVGDLLHGLAPDAEIDLLLEHPGGDVDVAEKLLMMFRTRSKSFRVIVPESAKSAGTLIAVGSDEIVMGYVSELGPIDPQIFITSPTGQTMARPAHSFLDGLEEIKQDVQKQGGQLSPAYLPLLQHYDPALLDFCRKAIDRARVFAEKWLEQYQCKGDPTKAKSIAKELGDVKTHLSHGAVIGQEKATKMGLNVRYLDPADQLWDAIWRLYCDYLVALQKSGADQIFESHIASISY